MPFNEDTYPYISGDAYRIRSSVDLTTLDFDNLRKLKRENFETIFLPVGRFGPFLDWLIKENLAFRNWNLIIHNGDFQPITSEMEAISNLFKRIYAVNWIGDQAIAVSIPIGIENRSFRRNGIPVDFKIINFFDFGKGKKHLLAIAFKPANNPSERNSLADKFKNLPGVFIPKKPLLPFSYKKLLKDSTFVLSPPGNGIDCHRTWESIYLKSIPVVLSRAWPFSKYSLPVLVLNSWDEITQSCLEKADFNPVSPLELWSMFLEAPFEEIKSE